MKMMERKAYTAFGETGRYRYSGGCDKNVEQSTVESHAFDVAVYIPARSLCCS